MKKLLPVIVILLFSFSARAQHPVGGEITYKNVGNDSFDITIKLYRDCNLSQILSPILVVTSACKVENHTLFQQSIRDITGLNPNCKIKSRCSGTFPYGFEEWVYTRRIFIGGDTCCQYKLSYLNCCRTNSITTGPNGTGFYIETTLDKCLVQGNSSPEFLDVPSFLLQLKQDETLNFNAADPDYDLLTYELVAPRTSATVLASYTGLFSPQTPLTFLGFPNSSVGLPAGFHVDSLAGIISFRPNKQNEVSTIVMKVTEWRVINGVKTKIGEVIRETIVRTVDWGNNKTPYFSNKTATMSICPVPGTYCMDISANDSDANDTLFYSIKHLLDSVTITNIGTDIRPIMRVCIKIDSAQIAAGKPFEFTAKVSDNACPFNASVQAVHRFVVGSYMPDSFTVSTRLDCRRLQTVMQNRLPYFPNLECKIELQTPDTAITVINDTLTISKVMDTGWYFVKTTITIPAFCDTRTYYDSVYVPAANFMTMSLPTDTLLCFAPAYTVTPLITNGTAPFTYVWNTSDTTPAITPIFQQGKNFYRLQLTDKNGCTAIDSMNIRHYNPTVTITGDTAACKNSTIRLYATLANTIKPVYGWAGADPGTTVIKPHITGNSQFVFTLADSSGCVVNKTHNVVASSPQISFTRNSNEYCAGDSVIITATVWGGIDTYIINWYPFQKKGTEVRFKLSELPETQHFFATVTDGLLCMGQKVDSIVKKPLPVISITSPGTYCENKGSVPLAPLALPAGGIWSGTGVAGTAFSTLNSGPGTFTLNYLYIHPATGCKSSASTTVSVDKMPVVDFAAALTTGMRPFTVPFINLTPDTSAIWSWTITDKNGSIMYTSTLRNPVYTFANPGAYTVELTATNGLCTKTVTKTNMITVATNVGTNEITGGGLNIYPNPANNHIMVEAAADVHEISITDALGRQLVTPITINAGNAYVDCSALNAGVYFITVYAKNGSRLKSSFIIAR